MRTKAQKKVRTAGLKFSKNGQRREENAEDEIDLTLDILGAPLFIPEFLSSDAEDCITKVIKEWEDKIDEVNTYRDFLLW